MSRSDVMHMGPVVGQFQHTFHFNVWTELQQGMSSRSTVRHPELITTQLYTYSTKASMDGPWIRVFYIETCYLDHCNAVLLCARWLGRVLYSECHSSNPGIRLVGNLLQSRIGLVIVVLRNVFILDRDWLTSSVWYRGVLIPFSLF